MTVNIWNGLPDDIKMPAYTNTEQERAGRYTKKPVTIEAVQFGRRFGWPQWFHDAVSANKVLVYGTGKHSDPREECFAMINTLEGVMRASDGDWIIRGVKGELYPCKPDVFAATYEPEQAARRAPVVPFGWMLVPAEATEEMERTFKAECTPQMFFMTTLAFEDFAERYRDMLAAAPQLPEAASTPDAYRADVHKGECVDEHCPGCCEPAAAPNFEKMTTDVLTKRAEAEKHVAHRGAENEPKTGETRMDTGLQRGAEMVSCACGDAYPARSYGAGFIDASGVCPNCEPTQSTEVLPPEPEATVNHSLTVDSAQLDDINVVDMAQAVDSKEAAPVQLPELTAEQVEAIRRSAHRENGQGDCWYDVTAAIRSTERKVRQILSTLQK